VFGGGRGGGHEATVELADGAGRREASLNRPGHQSGAGVQADGLDDVVIVETDSLPAVDGPAFDPEQGNAPGKTGLPLQPAAQDLRLGARVLDGGECGIQDIGRGGAGGRGQRLQLFRRSTHDLGAQAWQGGLKDFAYRLFNDVLDLCRTWHYASARDYMVYPAA